MAAHRCSRSAVLFIICSLSVFIITDSQETTSNGGQRDNNAVNSPQTATETAEQAVGERRWEATEAEAAADRQDTAAGESSLPASVPRPRDDFQEELVIRPLHSGDIYASFQFRTVWETDFMKGNKGQ